MKKIILHSVSIIVSMIWLVAQHNTYNPLSLKGPEFLKFYITLLSGFYASVVILKPFKETLSKTTVYFALFFLILGITKLIRGLILGKPIGHLMILLTAEFIIMTLLIIPQLNNKKHIT